MAVRAAVTPDLLRWARESMEIDVADAARKIKVKEARLEAAERGEAKLTLRQAEELAKLYQRPLALLFRQSPPDEPSPETQFRRLPGAPELPWPSSMHGLVREIRDRQDRAKELSDLLDVEPEWPRVASLPADRQPEELARVVRRLLRVPLEDQLSWRDRSGFRPLRVWLDSVEGLGVLVFQDSSVPLEKMRGFVSPDALLPAIVINTADDPRARTFTLLHELAHLLRAGESANWLNEEPYCNRFAAEILMPAQAFIDAASRLGEEREGSRLADELALLFGVTPLAAAIRIGSLQLIGARAAQALEKEIRERPAGPTRSGGNYYRNVIAWYGPRYIERVFSAADSGLISTIDAGRLLGGVKIPNQDKLRAELLERATR